MGAQSLSATGKLTEAESLLGSPAPVGTPEPASARPPTQGKALPGRQERWPQESWPLSLVPRGSSCGNGHPDSSLSLSWGLNSQAVPHLRTAGLCTLSPCRPGGPAWPSTPASPWGRGETRAEGVQGGSAGCLRGHARALLLAFWVLSVFWISVCVCTGFC